MTITPLDENHDILIWQNPVTVVYSSPVESLKTRHRLILAGWLADINSRVAFELENAKDRIRWQLVHFF
ncbi:hypothetical protein N7495_000248 [Penicillium taxi]|uniref:uncharacterized protein n=1 Tax=Penicillium taxi TaxID=168475 RepID=UPI002544E9F8|nr:uncharacterized protein N7495_000248 [Penicillium taxi]KAJ5907566.1 hypothetical protein N7495_000248 [Penicillium taxi]